MICDHLTNLLGFECFPLSEGGEIAIVHTPFQFEDGDALPVFVEVVNGHVRFFDDGATLRHFIGRGVRIENRKHATFLTNIAACHNAAFTETGEIEAWATLEKASQAFATYLCSMLAIASWEKDQEGQDTDTSVFVEEVAMAIKAWKPNASISLDPVFEGITSRKHKLDFLVDGRPVVAVGTHHNSVSGLLHRLVDIHGNPQNQAFDPLVIIDDRSDPQAATKEAKIIQAVATVMPFTSLGTVNNTTH